MNDTSNQTTLDPAEANTRALLALCFEPCLACQRVRQLMDKLASLDVEHLRFVAEPVEDDVDATRGESIVVTSGFVVRCQVCHDTGYRPTEDGRRFLSLVKAHLPHAPVILFSEESDDEL